MRNHFLLSFFALTILWCDFAIAAQTEGVVFIHGRGRPSLAEQENANGYWNDMPRIVTNDFATKSLIVHYDGSLVLEEAANTVAKQISEFITANGFETNSIKIIGHSYGGVVSRYIFSNPTNEPSFNKIIDTTDWVLSIGSPHLGSEASDLAERWLKNGNYFQRKFVRKYILVGESTWVLKTDNMNQLAEQCILLGTKGCPSLPKPFYVISGGHGDVLNDYYSEGHSEDLGLKMISELTGFPGSDDGMVAVYSTESIINNGEVILQSKANHHHLRNNEFEKIGTFIKDFM